jgi:hypothetical protein
MQMSWELVIPTLVGTMAGFIFSIALFYCTEKIKQERDRRRILKNLMRELTFNLRLYDQWLKGIEQARPQVGAGDKNIFLYIDYTRIARTFIIQALPEGLLYDILADEDLLELDTALRLCNPNSVNDFSEALNQWKLGNIGNPEMFQKLEFHRRMIEEGRKAFDATARKVSAHSQ